MITTKFKSAMVFSVVMMVGLLTTSAQTTIRLHGAVSAAKTVQPKQAQIESKTGTKLEVVGNGSGRGLADLAAGTAEIAMVGSSLKATAAIMNKEKPGSVDVSGLTEIPVNKLKLVFITHPSVGIKSITLVQLNEVLTGKTTNWKDVGGADLPIKVVLPFVGDGARTSVQDQVLNGADFLKTPILRNLSKELAPVVSQLPGACAFVSVKNVEGNITSVATDKEVFMPMVLAVKGEPSGDIKKVLDEIKPLFAE